MNAYRTLLTGIAAVALVTVLSHTCTADAIAQNSGFVRTFLAYDSSGNNVTGLSSNAFTVLYSRNGATPMSALATPTVTEIGNGRYALTIPSSIPTTIGPLDFVIQASGIVQVDLHDQVFDPKVINPLTATTIASSILVTPSNLLATDSSGRVTAGTVSDKSGYSLTQAFPTNFGSLYITSGGFMRLDLAQPLDTTNKNDTVGGGLLAARVQGFGKWVINGTPGQSGSTMTLYAADNTTVLKTFDMSSAKTRQ